MGRDRTAGGPPCRRDKAGGIRVADKEPQGGDFGWRLRPRDPRLVAASVAPGAATSRHSAGARFDPRLWADKCDVRSHLCGADVAVRSLLHASLLYLVVHKTLRSSADTPLLIQSRSSTTVKGVTF